MTEQEAYQEHIRYTMIPIVGLLFAMRPLTLPMCFFAFNIYSHSVATNAKQENCNCSEP